MLVGSGAAGVATGAAVPGGGMALETGATPESFSLISFKIRSKLPSKLFTSSADKLPGPSLTLRSNNNNDCCKSVIMPSLKIGSGSGSSSTPAALRALLSISAAVRALSDVVVVESDLGDDKLIGVKHCTCVTVESRSSDRVVDRFMVLIVVLEACTVLCDLSGMMD